MWTKVTCDFSTPYICGDAICQIFHSTRGHTHTAASNAFVFRTTNSALNTALRCIHKYACIRWRFALFACSHVCCSLPISLWPSLTCTMFWHLLLYSHTLTHSCARFVVFARIVYTKTHWYWVLAANIKETNSMCKSFVVHRRVCSVPLQYFEFFESVSNFSL